MFYAKYTQATSNRTSETHVLKFYSRADRASWTAEHAQAEAITAKQAARLTPAGAEYVARAKYFVYFSQIVGMTAPTAKALKTEQPESRVDHKE